MKPLIILFAGFMLYSTSESVYIKNNGVKPRQFQMLMHHVNALPDLTAIGNRDSFIVYGYDYDFKSDLIDTLPDLDYLVKEIELFWN